MSVVIVLSHIPYISNPVDVSLTLPSLLVTISPSSSVSSPVIVPASTLLIGNHSGYCLKASMLQAPNPRKICNDELSLSKPNIYPSGLGGTYMYANIIPLILLAFSIGIRDTVSLPMRTNSCFMSILSIYTALLTHSIPPNLPACTDTVYAVSVSSIVISGN